MSEPYTPTTEEVRAAASRAIGGDWFDRWLAEHDRQVAERAWDAGFDRGFYSGQAMRSDADASESTVENPYTKGEQK